MLGIPALAGCHRHAGYVLVALMRELPRNVHVGLFSTLTGFLRPHRNSHSTDHRQPGSFAQPVFNAVRPQNPAVRSGRDNRRIWNVRHGGHRYSEPYGATLPAGAASVNTFIRWLKFNLVGAMGMVVQLAAL